MMWCAPERADRGVCCGGGTAVREMRGGQQCARCEAGKTAGGGGSGEQQVASHQRVEQQAAAVCSNATSEVGGRRPRGRVSSAA
eukprot:2658108-Prymnesium_polylepis.1